MAGHDVQVDHPGVAAADADIVVAVDCIGLHEPARLPDTIIHPLLYPERPVFTGKLFVCSAFFREPQSVLPI